MNLEKFYQLLLSLVGRVVGQIVCTATIWLLIAGLVRLYAWLNGSIGGGVDPVKFALMGFLAFIIFYAWRFFAEADLEG